MIPILNKRFFLIAIFFIVLSIPSCTDNKGYDEYYSSGGNNPAMTIPWMESLVKDLRKTHAIIQAYTFNDETYYSLQIYNKNSEESTSPFTIYEGNEEQKIVYYHTDNVLKIDPISDSLYFDFKANSTFQYMVWKNVPKSDSNIGF